MNIDWEKARYADSSFLDEMSKEEREAWIAQETESADGWEDCINDISEEEMDDYMCRHSLGKYMYKKK